MEKIYFVILNYLYVIIGVDMNLILRAIEEKIAEKKVKGGLAYVKLKDSPLDEVFIRSQPISFSFDVKQSFLGVVRIVPSVKSEEDANLYRSLKGLECYLKYSGLFRRNAFFNSREELNTLKEMVPSMVISDNLITRLNNDPELKKLIMDIKPSELTILLKSVHEELLPFVTSKEYLLRAEAKFYENPTEVTWYITLTHMLIRGPKFTKNVRGIFEIMEIIGKHLREVSKKTNSISA